MDMPADTATPRRYRSDRWHRLDKLLRGMDEYVATRQAAGMSYHRIVGAMNVDLARHPEVVAPTVSTLTRWYPTEEQQHDVVA